MFQRKLQQSETLLREYERALHRKRLFRVAKLVSFQEVVKKLEYYKVPYALQTKSD